MLGPSSPVSHRLIHDIEQRKRENAERKEKFLFLSSSLDFFFFFANAVINFVAFAFKQNDSIFHVAFQSRIVCY